MWAHAFGFSALPHIGGILSWLLTRKEVPTWFESLKKPSWRPPNKMFPVVWTTLYTGMGYASYLVWNDLGGFNSKAVIPLGLYGAQLALNWAWTPLFFGAHKLKLALVDILCLYGLVLGTMYSWYPINKMATMLMVPYLAWLTLASSLTFCIWRDNPAPKRMAENQEEPSDTQTGEEQPENAEESEEKKKELEKLPPFEIVGGERFPAFFFKFQFRNVEYSSGRNKTFLCYVVETQGKESGSFRGYLEDEHAAAHAEDAFFNNILPTCDPNLRYNVTWYVSSSPCVPCADRIAQILQKNKNLRLSILVSRLFMWEEPEMQAALKKLKASGCKLKIMKPQDFEYIWQNFAEQEEGEAKAFEPWEDIQENFLYYEEKLSEVLH